MAFGSAFYAIERLAYSQRWIQCISKADKSDIVYSEKISYFFTGDEYDLYFTEALSTIRHDECNCGVSLAKCNVTVR